MSMIENKEVINFSDTKLRVFADAIAKLYNLGKAVNDEWVARAMSAKIPNRSTDILKDSAYGTNGADGDGRPVIDGADMNKLVNQVLKGIVSDLELDNNSKLKLVLRVAVNTTR